MKQFLKTKIREATKQAEAESVKFDNTKNINFYRGVRDAYMYLYRNPFLLSPDNIMNLYSGCKVKQTDYYDGACVAYKATLERLCKV